MNHDSLLSPDATVYGVIANDQISLDRLGDVSGAPYKGLAKAPVLYIKPVNTWSTDGAIVSLPAAESSVEVGAVFGLLMGRDAARLSESNAMDVVANCVLAADLSLPHDSYYRPAVRQKAFDGALPIKRLNSCSMRDFAAMEIKTYINGELKDTRKMSNLLRSPSQLLADVTDFMTLYAGDVLLLGVVFRSPIAKLGDQVKIEIPNITNLQFSIAKD